MLLACVLYLFSIPFVLLLCLYTSVTYYLLRFLLWSVLLHIEPSLASGMSRYDLNWSDLASNAPDIQQLGLFLFFVCLLVDCIWFWVLFWGAMVNIKRVGVDDCL
ncbi:hypothetical protein BDV24DRAFT_135681, partial [Aspergillus arachidicola]